MADRTGTALRLITRLRPGSGAAARTAHAWAVRNATALDQTARGYAFDLDTSGAPRTACATATGSWPTTPRGGSGGPAAGCCCRPTTRTWRTRRTTRPTTRGCRGVPADALGTDYVSVGTTFGQGRSTPRPGREGHDVHPGSAGGGRQRGDAGAGTRPGLAAGHPHRPAAARDWLDAPRRTRQIGTAYPEPEYPVALARSHDVVIHLRRVRAAELLPAP
ncbi:erythromycin esterase family protein [Streptomyces sp. M19]